MKVLGLDVSSTSTGAVVLRVDGVKVITEYAEAWSPAKKLKLDVTDRAVFMVDALVSVVREHDPDRIVIEGYGFASQSLAPQAEVKGVMLYALRQLGYGWNLCAPMSMKKFLGAKQKDDTRLAVFKAYEFEHPSNDVVDAYALARIALAMNGGDPKLLTKAQKEVISQLLKPV